MSDGINTYAPMSGRLMKEDGSIINVADLFRDLYVGNSITFHSSATITADGTALTVGTATILTVEINGTTTTASRTVSFYGAMLSGTLALIPGIKVSGDTNFTIATSTTGKSEFWQFDITNITTVYMKLTAITGDILNVNGRYT